jgi:hypothetical protein
VGRAANPWRAHQAWIEVAERTVSRLIPKRRIPPSQTWRTFLTNHVQDLVSIDFFTVPTARLRVLSSWSSLPTIGVGSSTSTSPRSHRCLDRSASRGHLPGRHRPSRDRDAIYGDVRKTLNWVLLANRFPVRILLEERDAERPFRMGTTAVVPVRGFPAQAAPAAPAR